MKEVVDEYEDVFEVLKQLPSHRSHDHRIPLIEGTQPVNIRPYRHPPTQKEAIEAMVKELYHDYRQLNKCTVKDKFPIPIIKELIDELCGAIMFSKLDLSSRYHQIRMYEEDVAKIAFKTHEFLVMPFGLTNALSTFQALMNEVFKKFLRKFTLVFFDDILVYNKTMMEYVIHPRMVLDIVRSNKLYAKQTKCVFGTYHVEYLGHIISAQGVATNPNKRQIGIRDWVGAVLQQQGENACELLKMFVSTVTTELIQNIKDSWVEDATLN
ncbi:putative mitochondrial protein, partial [Tanacetum coccineum]